MMWHKLVIEDTSDCAACTRRDAEAMATLRESRCSVLEDVTCQECGRVVVLLIPDLLDKS